MMKNEIRGMLATIWEFLGSIALLLLIVLPNQKSIIDMIMGLIKINQKYYYGISFSTIVSSGLFVLIYISSFKLFPQERSTKLFSIIYQYLMVATIMSLIIF